MTENAVLFALSANEALASSIAEKLGMKLSPRNIRTFPSGETLVEPLESVRGKEVFIIQSTCPPVNQNLMEILIFVDALRRASASSINLICPYFGYARQDRKSKPRQPITAALVANLLTTAGVTRVVTVNLHAAQEQGFFSCLVDDLTAIPLLANYVLRYGEDISNAVVVSPDHGGVARARVLADIFDCPLAIIDKRRNSHLEPEVMNIIGEIDGKDCYMVDDMIDTGRSAIKGAHALRAAGAKSVSYVGVHPVMSDPCFDLMKEHPFERMIITDSIPLPEKFSVYKEIEVVSLADMLAECIHRFIHNLPLTAVYHAYGGPQALKDFK